MMISARPRTFIDTTMMSREGENDNGISEENTTKDKGKRRGKRSNALKQKEEKPEHYRLLGIMESKTKGAKQRQPSFLVPADMSSEVATPVSTRAMKLFEAIREHELHQVEEELASLTSTDKSQIDKLKLGGHGFALIHVAARYNFARIAKVLIQRGADPNIRTEDYKWTPLHLAARFNGLATIVDVLLPSGANPTKKGKNGTLPLHLAARRGNDEVVKALLDHHLPEVPKVNVDAKDDSGKTALHLACREGHRNVCQILLDHKANIKEFSADKMTPLHAAIESGHSEVARMILTRAAGKDVGNTVRELIRLEDLQGNTVLHMAAWNNDVTIATLCVENGADVTTLNSNTVTALHLAATKGNLEVAEFLVSRGADVNMKDGDSKTPLHRAALFNQTKLIKFLLDNKAILNARDDEGRSPFLNAVAAGHVDAALDLLNCGADISASDLLMKTCFHIAVENEHVVMLAKLLERRPGSKDLNKRDVFDRVPLHYAAKTKDIKILELVLSKQMRQGSSFTDEHQKTPLHLAAEGASSKHVEALAKRMLGGVNARDEQGRTPLHSAVRKGQRKACVTLLNMGADVDSRDNYHRTPLMWAAKENQRICAQVLLDFKASPDLQDENGDSALHLACFGGHAAFVTLLLDRGVSLTLRNKQEFACLETAAKAGSCDVALAIAKHERWTELENYRTSHGKTGFSLLIENLPEAAEVILNQCVHRSEHINSSDREYSVTYNFKYLDHDPDMSRTGRFSAVKAMIKHKRERLLLHPLTLKFNEWKWFSLGRCAFISEFLTYLILMTLFTIFIVEQRKDQTFRPANYTSDFPSSPSPSPPPPPPPLKLNVSEYYKPKPSDIYRKGTAFTEVVPPMVLTVAVLHMCKELLQMYVQGWNYFIDLTNYLDWTLHVCAALFMAPFAASRDDLDAHFASVKDPRSLWIVGIVGIFVCYTNMMLFLRRYRFFGTYISMYVQVTKTVFKVMAVFIFLVLGFALVFYILFKEQFGFHTVHHSLLRVLVMMIGELDFGDLFIETIDSKHEVNQNPLNPFPAVGFFFLFLCLFLLSIALMNLLVGLAVGDTEKMKKYATITRLSMQLQYQMEIEEAYPNFIIRRAYQPEYIERPNIKMSGLESVSEWVKASFAEVSPEPIEEGEPSELAELRNEMIKNKKRIKSMMAMLEAQNKLLRNLAETIDPTAVLPEVPDDEFGADDVDGGPRAPLHQTEHGGKEPPEDKGVDVVT